MSLSMAIVLILILALVFLFARRREAVPKKRAAIARPAKAKATTEFHAVSLKFPSSACSAAKSLEGKRFLSSDAPRIPLPDCDVPACKCRFVHHQDRRESEDRRNSYRATMGGDTGTHQQEQRQGPDRRKDPDPF